MSDIQHTPAALPGGRFDDVRVDDEHRLIARYVERLSTLNDPVDGGFASAGGGQLMLTHDQRQQLVAELEAKNRAILREIQRLRFEQQQQQQQMFGSASPSLSDNVAQRRARPNSLESDLRHQLVPGPFVGFQSQQVLGPTRSSTLLVDELRLLRRRRDELEGRMAALQSSRRELMGQLETLMSVLKSRSTTPSSTSRSPHPPADFDPATFSSSPPLALVSGDVEQAFAESHVVRQMAYSSPSSSQFLQQQQQQPATGLSRDLIEATDYVTGAVTSLVRELNSDDSGESVEEIERQLIGSEDYAATGMYAPGSGFLSELRQHRLFRSADNRSPPLNDRSRDRLYDNDNNNYNNYNNNVC